MIALAGALALGCWIAAGPLQRPADSLATLRLDLNLPAYRLDAYLGDRIAGSYRVAIGTREYPTPTGDFRIGSVELNPTWTPPPSPWAEGKAAMGPGPLNPMGRAKAQLRPLYFLHGTPDSASIGTASSHGCVRLANQDMLALVRLLVESGLPSLPDSVRQTLIGAAGATRLVGLTHPVGVTVRYDLLEVIGDTVYAYPDPYRLRDPAADQMAQSVIEAAVHPRPVRPGIARRLLDAASREGTAVPLRDVGTP